MKETTDKAHQLKISNLSKDFGKIHVLQDISFSFNAGTSVAITGPSGSGKSTLLHIIGTLEEPSNGKVELTGLILLHFLNLNLLAIGML